MVAIFRELVRSGCLGVMLGAVGVYARLSGGRKKSTGRAVLQMHSSNAKKSHVAMTATGDVRFLPKTLADGKSDDPDVLKGLEDHCSEDWCTASDGVGGTACWAGVSMSGCSCKEGKAVLLGGTMTLASLDNATAYHYRCCKKPAGYKGDAKFVGEHCGDYKGKNKEDFMFEDDSLSKEDGSLTKKDDPHALKDLDEDQCSEDWCLSPSVEGGNDCWAGSTSEPCSCKQGEAVLLGATYTKDNGDTYYHYRCCKKPSGYDGDAKFVGEQCGDYKAPGSLQAVFSSCC
eukprot:g12006.t1